MKSYLLRQNRPRGSRLEMVQLEDRTTPTTGTFAPQLVWGSLQFPSPDPSIALGPNQIRTAYGINAIPAFGGTVAANGAGQTIAIVDAYDAPAIAADLASFDQYYGTAANGLNAQPVSSFFKKVNQNGGSTPPGVDPTGGWEGEEALDVEYAHSIAPAAKIILVETNDPNSLFQGDQWAGSQPGITIVSNSWGSTEYHGQN